ncbi:MAG: pyridoxine 5'-phosphate synthase [Candidatus Hydrothermales bacterium]
MRPIKLSVNVDHVATLREARKEKFPDPLVAAIIAEQAGACGITCHIRLDKRHIKEGDVEKLRKYISGELNLEMCSQYVDFALKVKPDWVTLVPEREGEVTTEGGLDLKKVKSEIKESIEKLRGAGIKVSLFIEPDEEMIDIAKELGVDAVELNTNSYVIAKGEKKEQELQRLKKSAKYAKSKGLTVKAGHGLTRQNIIPLLEIEEIEEVSVGFAIIADSVLSGLYNTVKEYREILSRRSV